MIKKQDSVIVEAQKNIKLAEKVISTQDELDRVNKDLRINLKEQVVTKDKESKTCLDNNAYLNKQLKFQKRKTTAIISIGTTIITALSYVIIKK